MTRVTIEGLSDSPVTIPTTPPITVTPVNNTYSRLLTSEQRDQFTAGQVITLTSDDRTATLAIPDYTDTRVPTITPANNTVFTTSSRVLTILPLSEDWRYGFQVVNSADNSIVYASRALGTSNQFTASGLPTGGEGLTAIYTVDKDDGQGVQTFTRTYTAHTIVNNYAVFDTEFARNNLEVREFGVNIDDQSGAIVTTLVSGQRYRIKAPFRDTDGLYSGNRAPDDPVVPLTTNAGTPEFIKRANANVNDTDNVFNIYDFTPSTTSAGPLSFNWGVSGISVSVDLTIILTTVYGIAPVSPLRVTQNVEGYGTQTAAGRGGQVYVVTSTATTGAGTFAEAMAATGPRQIIFDVSGPIIAPDQFIVGAGQVSVYGQTARGDGVYLRGAVDNTRPAIFMRGSDVLFEHFRFRRGGLDGNGGSADSIVIGDPNTASQAERLVFNHCSFSWGVDEVLDTFGVSGTNGPKDITFIRCLISEGLFRNSHSNSTVGQGYLAVIGRGTERISFIHNIWSCCDQRAPGIFGAKSVDVFNNVIAGYESHAINVQPQFGSDCTGDIKDNLFIDTFTGSVREIGALANPPGTQHPPADIRMHVSGNGRQTGPNGSAIGEVRVAGEGGVTDPTTDIRWNQPSINPPRPTGIPLASLENALIADVGASFSRDQTDARQIAELQARSMPLKSVVGGVATTKENGQSNADLVGTEADVPWPVMATGPSKLGSDPTAAYIPVTWRTQNNQAGNPISTDSNNDGFTDFEDWLSTLDAPPSTEAVSTVIGSRGYTFNNAPRYQLSDVRVANNIGEFLAALGPNRVVIPNFSGWHTVASTVNMGHPGLWVPGQLSPAGFGLTVGSGPHNLVEVGGSNVTVLEHFSLAPTSDGADGNVDPIRSESTANSLLVRNMHLFWGRDQQTSIWFNSRDVVFDQTIWGPSLLSQQGRGPLFGGGTQRVLVYRCAMMGCWFRNPMVQAPDTSIINSIVAGWAGEAMTFQDTGGGISGNARKNLFLSGPDSNPARGEVLLYNAGGSNFNVHLLGNIGTRQPDPNGNQVALVATVATNGSYNDYADNDPNNYISADWVGTNPNVPEINASQLQSTLWPIIGPTPARRNSKITSMIAAAQNGTLTYDNTGSVAELPPMVGGTSFIDNSRADKIGSAGRAAIGMPDGANGLTEGPIGSQYPYFFHFCQWAAGQ